MPSKKENSVVLRIGWFMLALIMAGSMVVSSVLGQVDYATFYAVLWMIAEFKCWTLSQE